MACTALKVGVRVGVRVRVDVRELVDGMHGLGGAGLEELLRGEQPLELGLVAASRREEGRLVPRLHRVRVRVRVRDGCSLPEGRLVPRLQPSDLLLLLVAARRRLDRRAKARLDGGGLGVLG